MQIELLEIDFNSEEAIYMQLRNQIILGIATSRLQDGDTLPSVRQMAECIGINMHTVNKAYAVLRKEGIVSIDRRKGAVICIDSNKLLALEEMRRNLYIILAKGRCHNISRQEAHQLLDEIYDMWEQSPKTRWNNLRAKRTRKMEDRTLHEYTIYESGKDSGKICGKDSAQMQT